MDLHSNPNLVLSEISLGPRYSVLLILLHSKIHDIFVLRWWVIGELG
jgi:hypothetical protein